MCEATYICRLAHEAAPSAFLSKSTEIASNFWIVRKYLERRVSRFTDRLGGARTVCSQDVARKEGQSWPELWKAHGSCCTRFQLPRSWCGGRKFRRETRITTAAPAAISGLTMLCNLVGWSLSATTPTAQCNRVLRRACFPSTDYLRRFLARRAMGDIRPTISHPSRASPATSRMSAPRIFTRGGASRRRRSPFRSTKRLNYLKTSMDSQAGSAPNRG